MKTYEQILAEEVATAVEASNRTVLKGQVAALELAVTEEFIQARTTDMVRTLLDVDPTNLAAIQVLAIGLKALRELHNYLTQAVADGTTAAMRLHENANQGAGK